MGEKWIERETDDYARGSGRRVEEGRSLMYADVVGRGKGVLGEYSKRGEKEVASAG